MVPLSEEQTTVTEFSRLLIVLLHITENGASVGIVTTQVQSVTGHRVIFRTISPIAVKVTVEDPDCPALVLRVTFTRTSIPGSKRPTGRTISGPGPPERIYH